MCPMSLAKYRKFLQLTQIGISKNYSVQQDLYFGLKLAVFQTQNLEKIGIRPTKHPLNPFDPCQKEKIRPQSVKSV